MYVCKQIFGQTSRANNLRILRIEEYQIFGVLFLDDNEHI